MLDANGVFGMTTETLRVLDFYGEMRDVIVVGVGYPGAASFPATMARRTRDYTPTDEGWYVATYVDAKGIDGYAGEGRAAAFLTFLSDELMPFVEQRFRTTEERSITGYSFGGLFALYALFTRPGLFKRYLVCSPSIWWGGGMIADVEGAYAAAHADLPAWLWMATGSEEGDDVTVAMLDLAATLSGREYPSLVVTASLLAGEEHLSAFPPFISRALRAAFTKP